jgi:uncharacterized protein
MPPSAGLRLVLDTNVLLAGLASKSSASQKIVDSLRSRKVIPLLSTQVIAEYHAILLHPAIRTRFPNLTARRVELALCRLRYVGDVYPSIRTRFELQRDPKDAIFVELAIAGEATHLVTMDADLLSLPHARTDAGRNFRRRLPRLIVLAPQAFMETWGRELGFR